MKTIFETCEPRQEVLTGELREEIFAARLKDVMDGTADPIYQDPATFFDNTFPTTGLKSLLDEALGRLTGVKPMSSPVIRLETSFGGGKTHNLIALYHLASGNATESMVDRFVDPGLVPPTGQIKVAGVVGSERDLTDPLVRGDVLIHTLWGEIAYQLGGPEAYELINNSDQARVAPGAQSWERVIGDQAALIMLDELARYIRAAKGVPVGKTYLDEMVPAFLNSLLEFAASRERVVVVMTMAGPEDAFPGETEELRMRLAEARDVSARQELVMSPTVETEIPAIVTHRLFRSIDCSAAEETARGYWQYLEGAAERGADLPPLKAEWAQEIVDGYPLHPGLLNVMHRKLSTIPNFQKTRGALRLLARVVRQLWEDRPANTFLIHPHHIDLSNEGIIVDLTSRLERPAFRQVMEADIASPLKGTKSHAQLVDDDWVGAGQAPYAQRAATNIFLHSLTIGPAAGVSPSELVLATVQPEDEFALVQKALERLVDICWFLDWDGRRYRFSPEIQIPKVIADEKALVGKVAAKQELDTRIQKIWGRGVFVPKYFPSEAGEVDDDAREPKLVVIHYDAATVGPSDTEPPELVLKIAERAGSLEGYRIYKNNLLFLVADSNQVDRMVEVAQKYLAIRRIVGDPQRLADFPDQQRKKLKQLQETAELDVRVAITKAYRYLYYPSADAPKSAGNLARQILPVQDQGEVKQDQSGVVLRVLRGLEKVLTADDPGMPAAFLRAKAWPANRDSVTTEDLRKAFAQRAGLKMLLDPDHLKRTIKDGIARGDWIYYSADEQVGYGKDSPPPLVRIAEESELYTIGEAQRVGIAIKGAKPKPEVCPVCREPAAQCTCGLCPRCGQRPCVCQKPRALLRAEGAPGQVFQAIADRCHDEQVTSLRSLAIHCEGAGKEGASDARAVGLAIPQLGKGRFRVDQSMAAEFGVEESMSLKFSGYWDRYKRVKQLTDPFGQEASRVSVTTTLHAEFPDGLLVEGDQFQTMRDVFVSLGLGRLVVEAQQLEETKGADS
jgi:hypothetical protein